MNLLSRDKHVMPWRVEDEMKKLGANYIQAGLWRGFAVRDGNLVTGQQNFSGGETAAVMVKRSAISVKADSAPTCCSPTIKPASQKPISSRPVA